MLCLVIQLCPTLCDPMDCSLPGSSVHGILQTRILEWVAMASTGYFPNPEIKSRSPALRQILYHLSHQGSPNVSYSCPFSPCQLYGLCCLKSISIFNAAEHSLFPLSGSWFSCLQVIFLTRELQILTFNCQGIWLLPTTQSHAEIP